MIKVSDSDGNTAAYYISPYPHWLGEEGLVAKVEALRAEMNREQLAAGLDPSSLDRAVSTTLRQPDSAFTVATPRW